MSDSKEPTSTTKGSALPAPSSTGALPSTRSVDSTRAAARAPRRNWTSFVLTRFGLLIILAVLFVIFSVTLTDTFFTTGNLTSLLLLRLPVPGLLALAVLLPSIVGEFDLSPGYLLGLTAVVSASLGKQLGLDAVACIAGGLVVGLIVGVVNGLLVGVVKIQSLIATLGIGIALSGLSVGVSGSQTISTGIPAGITGVTLNPIGGIATGVWITIVIFIAAWIVLEHTPVGRRMYAVGGNERVAQLAGIRVRLLKVGAFAVGGVLAAASGVFQLGLTGSANPNYGTTLLLPAFAAVFLGTTAIRPGAFNVWGTLIAVLVLGVGFSGLSLAGVPFWVEPVFDGVLLITAVLITRVRRRRHRTEAAPSAGAPATDPSPAASDPAPLP